MQFVTDFADQAVVLPLVLVTAAAMWLGGWGRGALAWSLVCGATLGLVGAAKLIVFAYGPFAGLPLLLSPSGHTASAALVYGGFAGLLFAGPRPRFLAPIAALLAGGIGISRVMLGLHTLPDVLVGAAIGLAGAIALEASAGRRPEHFRRVVPLAVGGAVLIGFHGLHLPAEPWLRLLAERLGGAP